MLLYVLKKYGTKNLFQKINFNLEKTLEKTQKVQTQKKKEEKMQMSTRGWNCAQNLQSKIARNPNFGFGSG